MRILVTGTSGQVVTSLSERGKSQGFDIISLGRPEFDLADPEPRLSAIADANPDVIVSAAAYTAVDRAESEEHIACVINAFGPGLIAGAASRLGVPVVHLSTDYVFDGTKVEPYIEGDETNPINVYGRTKLAGERAIAAATPNHVILRTAWVYSPFGNNFLKTMLRVAAERTELRIVSDQIGNPTSALDIADTILRVACNLRDSPQNPDLRGTFHMTGNGDATWAEFASEIFSITKDLGGPSADVINIASSDYPTVARRPANSRLNSAKLQLVHAASLPEWQQSTRSTLIRLLDGIV